LFPLGTEEFGAGALPNQLPATTTGPPLNRYQVGEVYRAVKLDKFVGLRYCKGDPQDAGVLPNPNPSTINCSAGEILTGQNDQGLFTFPGNWSGSGTKTINSQSGTGPFDILANQLAADGQQLLFHIIPETVTASADNGPEVPNRGCNDQPSQGTERCFFTAKNLLPNGCTSGVPVDILVRGQLDIQDGNGNNFKFVSKDNPTCQ